VNRDLNPPAIVRPAEDLAALAHAINAAHIAGEAAARRGLEHFREAGEKLQKAKAQCGHGKWTDWLKKNLKFSPRRAQRYMALAKCDVTSDLEEQWRVISGNAREEAPPPLPVGEVLEVPVAQVRVGKRYRKDLGDIKKLAVSISEIGLVQYILINPDYTLVCGLRRLAHIAHRVFEERASRTI
jgi:hypothetical protein